LREFYLTLEAAVLFTRPRGSARVNQPELSRPRETKSVYREAAQALLLLEGAIKRDPRYGPALAMS
jgi:hypothetical protein